MLSIEDVIVRATHSHVKLIMAAYWIFFLFGHCLGSLTTDTVFLTKDNIQEMILPFTMPNLGGADTYLEQKLSVQLLGIEHHYRLKEKYFFYLPTVDVSCGPFNKSGNDITVAKLEQPHGPPCHLAFYIQDDTKYKAMKFVEPKAKYLMKFRLEVEGHQWQVDELIVPLFSGRLLYGPNLVLRLNDMADVTDTKDRVKEFWLYQDEESVVLRTGVPMNGKGEQDLKKLGWFQVNDTGHRLIDPQKAAKALYIKNSKGNVSWVFDGSYYYTGKTLIPSEIPEVSFREKYGDIFSHVCINSKMGKYYVEPTKWFPIQLDVTAIQSIDDVDVFFNAAVFQHADHSYLNFYMVKGIGKFEVNVHLPHREKQIFHFEITEGQLPYVTWKLETDVTESVLVCVREYSGSEETCRVVDVGKGVKKNELEYILVWGPKYWLYWKLVDKSFMENICSRMCGTVLIILSAFGISAFLIFVLKPKKRAETLKKKDVFMVKE